MQKKYVITNSIISGIAFIANLFFLVLFLYLLNNEEGIGLAVSLIIFIAAWIFVQIYNVISIIIALVTIKKSMILSIIYTSVNVLLAVSTLLIILSI